MQMTKTKNSPFYINASNKGFDNLNVELLNIHEKLETISKLLKEQQDLNDNNENKDVTNISLRLDAISKEFKTLEDKIKNINNNCIDIKNEYISTNTEFVYKNGLISKEIISGDIEITKEYEYDINGNITKEVLLKDNKVLGNKEYSYDQEGNIKKIINNKAENVNIATTSFAFKDLDRRMTDLENTDITDVTSLISSGSIRKCLKAINTISNDVELLKNTLPNNVSNIGSIPAIIDRVKDVEDRVYNRKPVYIFYVKASQNAYPIPKDIDERTSIFLEGILLVCNQDYTLEDEKIIFKVPLQDDFYVQCKY